MADSPRETLPGAALDSAPEAPIFAEQGDRGQELRDGRFDRPPFPPACPVKPLGLVGSLDGQKCYYLDVQGNVVSLDPGHRHGKNNILALFGDQSAWLEVYFPQWSAPRYEGRGKERVMVTPSEIVGFDQADASRAMIEQCSREGGFDPTGKLRGRGAHTTASFGLALHLGDAVLVTKQRADGSIKGFEYRDCGRIERHVYPKAEATPRPWHDAVDARPGQKLLKLLRTWHWRRDLLDPRLLIGWIGAAMLGGALKWRPNIWITGSSGTGKSTLNGEGGVLDLIFGAGVVRTGNASAAAIRQLLKNSTLPVLFDEIEASADNRKVQEVIELARVSSSGATMHRGGADHTAHEFTLRSCFQFSSINIPPLQTQDRSRLGILELLPFGEDVAPLDLREWALPELGRQLQRRMLDGWRQFEGSLARFQLALMKSGHDRRAADQFGTLLAAADVLLNPEPADDEELAEWARRCTPRLIAEVADSPTDHDACLAHLTTSLVQGKGSDERETMGNWIGRVVGGAKGNADELVQDKANERLEQRGLKVVNARWNPPEQGADGLVAVPGRWGTERYKPGEPGFLGVARSHRGLNEIFQGTIWQGGVWRQALARVPGCIEPVKVRFSHQTATAVLVPLTALMDDDQLPPASRSEAAAEWMARELAGVKPGQD